MSIDGILDTNEALGCAFVVVLLLVARANRIFLRDVARDGEAFWRFVAKWALASLVVLVAWGSVLDNWRQLVGAPFRMAQRFPSQRGEYNPPPAEVRTITVVLLGIALIPVACLLARHVAGYILQAIFAFSALVLWVPLFAIRQRLNVNLAFGFDGSWSSPLDVFGYLLFVLLAWAVEIALMLLLFVVLLSVVAIPVTLVLDILRRRRPRATGEAAAFFSSFGQRLGSEGQPETPTV